jgi:hypothetical protein
MTVAGLRRCLHKPCTEEEGTPSNRKLPSSSSIENGRNTSIPDKRHGEMSQPHSQPGAQQTASPVRCM